MNIIKKLDHDVIDAVRAFSLRFVVVLAFALLTGYFVGKNWSWYTKDLQEEVKIPVWANPTVNMILWIVWYAALGLIWHRNAEKHPDTTRIDLFYPIILLVSFLTLLLFFSMHDLGAAKWFGVLLVILVAYMVYEAFVADYYVGAVWIIHLGITLYTVAQLWYFDKNHLDADCNSMCSADDCECRVSQQQPLLQANMFY